jgi:hypothetical protein
MSKLEIDYNTYLINAGNIYTLCIFINICIGYYYYNKFNSTLKLFYYYNLFDFSVSLLLALVNYQELYFIVFDRLFKSLNITDTNFFQWFSFFNVFIILSFYFSNHLIFFNNKIRLWQMGVIIFIFIFLKSYFENSLLIYNSLGQSLLAIFMLIYSGLHLYRQFTKEITVLPLFKNPYFWINISLFLPASISIIYGLLGESIYTEDFISFCKLGIFVVFLQCIAQFILIFAYKYAKNTKYLSQE